MDITSMQPSIIDLLGILRRAKGVEILVDHPSFKPMQHVAPEAPVAKDELKFTPSSVGVPVDALVFNERSENISLTTSRAGIVDCTNTDAPKGVPPLFPTRMTRNCAIIRDGELVVTHLPIQASEDALMVLRAYGFYVVKDENAHVIKLEGLPKISDRTPVPSSEEFAQKHYRLLEVQAACRVYKHFAGETERQAAFEHVYGFNAANWLFKHGITVNGFSPKRSRSTYNIKLTLECKVKGAASDLPSVEEAQKKIEDWHAKKLSKLPLPVSLMHHALLQVNGFKCSDIYLNPLDKLINDVDGTARTRAQEALLAHWARLNFEAADQERRSLLREIGQMTFVVLERFRQNGASFSNDKLEPNVGLTVPVQADLDGIRATITLKVQGDKNEHTGR